MMNGDYAKIAEGMGAVGITCTKVGEVGPAILKARELNAAGTACLIQVMANVEDRRALSSLHTSCCLMMVQLKCYKPRVTSSCCCIMMVELSSSVWAMSSLPSTHLLVVSQRSMMVELS